MQYSIKYLELDVTKNKIKYKLWLLVRELNYLNLYLDL